MIKVKVTKKFIDAKTNEVYKRGQEIELDKARFDEIKRKLPNYIKVQENNKTSQSKKPKKQTTKKQTAKKQSTKTTKKKSTKEDE